MKQVAIFMGTRPEGIKMAPVVKAIDAEDGLQPIVVSTGQHKEMLQQVVDLFDIKVDHDLEVMQPNQTLPSLTARLITRIDALLDKTNPDFALVQGDTTTVFTAALCCFYRGIPVGHVEAGLRTGNMRSPFPEEANRRLACPLVSLHFPPTETSRENLIRELVDSASIFVTGNTVIDALNSEVKRQADDQVANPLKNKLETEIGEDFTNRDYVLVTGHRRENFGGGFEQICEALVSLAKRHQDVLFIYPVHLNPKVQQPVHDSLGQFENIKLISPPPYSEFVSLINHSRIVLTDSGGVQEEAPSLGKPVLVMRDTTERPEGVAAGTVKLVGASSKNIIQSVNELLENPTAYEAMAQAKNPYGDGQAAGRIAAAVRSFLYASDGH
jgi:UDP-N-acetylglucosamine 2-epimerase (non-hydrolysing)